MLSRHLHVPYKFYCITDDLAGLDKGVEGVQIWESNGLKRCRRLRIFDESMRSYFGDRILQLDIDCVIVNDITPLVNRPEPMVIWRCVPEIRYVKNLHKTKPNGENGVGAYNTSMVLMDTGLIPQLWPDYTKDPRAVEREAQKQCLWTSLYNHDSGAIRPLADGDDDQAVISLYAKRLEPPIWMEVDGIYKWGRRGFSDKNKLPDNARIVFFNGSMPVNRVGFESVDSPAWVKANWQ